MATAFGLVATQAGLSPAESLFMSIFVFAGAAQFIAVNMITAGASVSAVVLTTFLTNLRHVLMSTSLAEYLKGVKRGLLPIFSFGVTDETFAVNINNFRRGNGSFEKGLVVNFLSYSSWVSGTLLGAVGGEFMPNFLKQSLYFALPAMFIGLLFLSIRTRLEIMVAIFAAFVSTFFFLKLGSSWNIVLAGITGATFGVLVERWTQR